MSAAHEARRALATLVDGDEGQPGYLSRGALLVAQEEYPDLDNPAYLGRLEQLGATVSSRLVGQPEPARQIAVLNELLFGEEGFRGNAGHYYDPRNSYLNEVLDRRLGIPLTLSLVYVEVAQRAGLAMHGVGLPGHFIVAFSGLLIDPFNCGRLLSQADCQHLLRQTYGGSVRLQPEHLAATPPRTILARLITNLKVAYRQQGDLQRAVRASEQLSVVLPGAAELLERAQLRYQLGDLAHAAEEFEQYLELEPAAADAPAVQRQLAMIRELYERRN